jgi:hypothetical protein
MTPPRRRWFAFTLRTMFVGVTMLGILSAWVGYSYNWIIERHQFRRSRAIDVAVPTVPREHHQTTILWPQAVCGSSESVE